MHDDEDVGEMSLEEWLPILRLVASKHKGRVSNQLIRRHSQKVRMYPHWRIEQLIFNWVRAGHGRFVPGKRQVNGNVAPAVVMAYGYEPDWEPSDELKFAERKRTNAADDANEGAEHTECSEPTQHLPGSSGKVEVLLQRAMSGQPLFHPDDRTYDDVVAGSEPHGKPRPNSQPGAVLGWAYCRSDK